MLIKFPEIKEDLIKKEIEDPNDPEWDFFLDICNSKIPYLASMSDDFLK